MVHYCRDCIIPSRLGQLCDEVHSDSLEWKRMFQGDRNHSGFEESSVDFTFLTSGTTFDILLNVLSHVRPPEVLLGQGVSICNSWVSVSQVIMEKLNYPPLQIVVTSNNGLGPLPPMSVFMD